MKKIKSPKAPKVSTDKSMDVEQRYCDTCTFVHWMQVEYNFSRAGVRLTCHGPELYPVDSDTHIVKSTRYGFRMIRRTKLYTNLPVVLAPMPERAPVEVDF